MAEDVAEPSQRTEQPTQKRLDDARAKGNVARFAEARHAAMFAGAAIATATTLGSMAAGLTPLLAAFWGDAETFMLTAVSARSLAGGVAADLAVALAPTLALLVGAAIVAGLSGGRPTLAWERVRPKWSKLSPMAGFKRLFGMNGLVEFLKTVGKFAIIALAASYVVGPETTRVEAIVGSDVAGLAATLATLVFRLLVAVTAVVLLLAVLDVLYSRWSFQKRMMMTRQEVREEHKQTEASPEVRTRIREIRNARSRQRMMAAVPTATVVLMNPTHYAVALRYTHGKDAVPVCVAKGADDVAFRIRDVARANAVPVLENPPLARALFASIDIDEPVPTEHFAAVAEVIGYVLRMAGAATQLPHART